MAQQIKKKFLSDEVINYFDDQIQNVSGEVSSEQSRAESAEQALDAKIEQEVLDRQSGDQSTLASANEHTDSKVLEEKGLREAADLELDGRITTLEGQVGENLQSAIANLEAADAGLQSQITQEISDRESADASLQSQITSIQGAGDVLFEDNSGVYADSTAPVEDPTGRDGWYYKSAGSPEKINWYFHDGQTNPVTVGQFKTLYTVATVDSSSNDTFHLAYYTFPLGDGQDAGSWYRSRIVYVPSGNFERGVKTLFYMGQAPAATVYPDLPRVQMVVTSVAGSSVGLNGSSEVISTAVFGTNSAAEAGKVELLVNKLAFNSLSYNKEYSLEIRGEFTLAGIKQSLLEESIERQNFDSSLQSNIDSLSATVSSLQVDLEDKISVEKTRAESAESALSGRIDVLEADPTTKSYVDGQIANLISNTSPEAIDSFTEVVAAFESADANLNNAITNLANSASSNLAAEESARIAADDALSSRITTLESKGFSNGSVVVGSELGFIDLDKEYIKIMSCAVGRMAIHEGEDFTVSVVGGVTRLTWIGSLVNPGGAEAIETGDKVFFVGAH